jgi:putative oxidoreductase
VNVGRLAARVIIGGLFVGHGAQKLFGSFGGPGIEGTEAMMDALEMRPARRNAYAAGIAETAGGALLTIGLATPVAAAALIGTMATAIRKVHLPKGPWVSAGGYEYNLVLIAGLMAIVDGGAGDLSVDRALGMECRGPKWSLGALATGLAASAATVALAEHSPAPSAMQ